MPALPVSLPVYLDNSATTPVDPRVVEKMLPWLTERFGVELWLPRAEWDLILIDERLGLQSHPPLVSAIRERLPTTALVLQTDRSDSTAAVTALQAGADFLLFKKSPAFLTELVLYAKGAIEQRQLRATLTRTHDRHTRLLETLTDVFYEVDAEGRFVFVSPAITGPLGYTPEELTGAPFSKLIPPDQLDELVSVERGEVDHFAFGTNRDLGCAAALPADER